MSSVSPDTEASECLASALMAASAVAAAIRVPGSVFRDAEAEDWIRGPGSVRRVVIEIITGSSCRRAGALVFFGLVGGEDGRRVPMNKSPLDIWWKTCLSGQADKGGAVGLVRAEEGATRDDIWSRFGFDCFFPREETDCASH